MGSGCAQSDPDVQQSDQDEGVSDQDPFSHVDKRVYHEIARATVHGLTSTAEWAFYYFM